MGYFIVAQPNGKFAYWSTIVDDFLLWNATPQDIINFRVKRYQRETTEEVNNTCAAISKVSTAEAKRYGHYSMPFAECLADYKRVHRQVHPLAKLKKKKKNEARFQDPPMHGLKPSHQQKRRSPSVERKVLRKVRPH